MSRALRAAVDATAYARLPDIYAGGRWWPATRGEALAAGWLSVVNDRLGSESVPCAAAIPFSPDGVALFAALSARRAPVVLLGTDPSTWPDGSPLLRGLTLVLPKSAAAHTAHALNRGFIPLLLDDAVAGDGRIEPLRCDGFVVQSSGSTGTPKTIFRPTTHVVAGAMMRSEALGLVTGDGIVGGVPFSSGHGVVQLVTAMVLRGALGLLDPVDHRQALTALARPEFRCWRATPHFADVLGRCRLQGAPVVPEICLISSALGESVHRAFLNRFGVPIRGTYSSTETGAVAVDAAPLSEVRWDGVGRVLPEVDVHIGLDPHGPCEDEAPARIWVRSPWLFGGYGAPPHLDRPGMIDGFWPTRDLGRFDDEGRLMLCGRLDDCIRTREGRLVDLDVVASALRAIDGVREVVVVPVAGAAGPSFAAVVHCDTIAGQEDLRRRISAVLPAWSLPRRILVCPDLPRLPNGKPDRLACLALVHGEAEPA